MEFWMRRVNWCRGKKEECYGSFLMSGLLKKVNDKNLEKV